MARSRDSAQELFSDKSSFFLCGLLHQTGAQYSAVEKTRAWVEMRRVFVAAPQVVQGDLGYCFQGPVELHSKVRRCCFEQQHVAIHHNFELVPCLPCLLVVEME